MSSNFLSKTIRNLDDFILKDKHETVPCPGYYNLIGDFDK